MEIDTSFAHLSLIYVSKSRGMRANFPISNINFVMPPADFRVRHSIRSYRLFGMIVFNLLILTLLSLSWKTRLETLIEWQPLKGNLSP
jgi:hypothetical protein